MTPVIFINCQGHPFVDDIIAGRKTYETRTRNTLKSLLQFALGECVLIAETGHGDPVVRCSAVIDHFGAVYTEDRWNDLRKVHAVPVGSEYDWNPDTKVKWLYHLTDVKTLAPFRLPKDCPRHGRVWAEYREE